MPDIFAFFNPGQYKPTLQQLSGGLVSAPAAGPSLATRSAEAQSQADASSTTLTQGNGNPLGLPPINWLAMTNAIGGAQNLISSTSQNAGNGLATGLSNFGGGVASEFASNFVSDLFTDPTTGLPSSPFVSAAAGALAGAVTSKFTTGLINSEVTKLLGGINLQPIQQVLGQTLGVLHKTEDTFGFLFPSPPDYQDISLSGRLTQPVAKDGEIMYQGGAPFIPTMTHHKIVWSTPDKDQIPVTALRRSRALASRMTFKLEGRRTTMSLLVNPSQLQISRSNVMSSSVSRSGFIVNPVGPGEFDVNVTGSTAVFYEEGGLSPRESKTVAYSNLLMLYNFFANNGYLYDDEASIPIDAEKGRTSQITAPSAADLAPPLRRINSMSYVTIAWQKWLWWGFFKSFKITDTAEDPYVLKYDFVFRVCHETDSFKIDNARADARQIPPVTGHVMEGYSAERTLAQRVLSNENPPNTFQGGITHKNIILSDFMFSDNSPTSCLNPTVSMVEAVKRLSLGGFSLTQVSGPDGVRYFGQSPDGTSIDLNGRDNQRAVTVVLNGGTPMHFASVAQDGYDSAGNPLVTGTMVVSPGDVPFKYSVLGHTVE